MIRLKRKRGGKKTPPAAIRCVQTELVLVYSPEIEVKQYCRAHMVHNILAFAALFIWG